MEQLSDLSGLPDQVGAELKRCMDRLGGFRLMSPNFKLIGGYTPNRATLSFFKEGTRYCVALDRPIHYMGESAAMKRLGLGTPVVFLNFGMILYFFQGFQPEPPQNTPPANSRASPEEDYNLDHVADMNSIKIPQKAAQATPDYKAIRGALSKMVFGQEQAVETIAYQVALHLGKRNPKRPLSIMAYGPPGRGYVK